MKTAIILLIATLTSISLFAQQRINSNFSFQTDPAKKYSLYIPSSYSASTPNKMILGLHPLNPSRWNAESWCDTLSNFAESNNLILVCPDGDLDGKIDDPIDTAFTSALLDSIRTWYNIADDKTYLIGFSWGARTAYTYGLNRPNVFGGYIPIGAAITNTNEVGISLQNNSSGKPIYIIHGSSDSPNTRFYPIRDSLIAKEAIIKTNLLSGVGHTIDFADRDAIISTAYKWIDSVNCYQLTTTAPTLNNNAINISFFPNPIKQHQSLSLNVKLKISPQLAKIKIIDLQGKNILNVEQFIQNGNNKLENTTDKISSGTYLVSIILKETDQQFSQKIILE